MSLSNKMNFGKVATAAAGCNLGKKTLLECNSWSDEYGIIGALNKMHVHKSHCYVKYQTSTGAS